MGRRSRRRGRDGSLTLEVVEVLTAFQGLRDEWNTAAAAGADPNVFMTWDWLHTWWTHFGEPNPDARLHIVTLRDEDGLVAAAPLFRMHWGYGPLRAPVMHQISYNAGMLLVRPRDGDADQARMGRPPGRLAHPRSTRCRRTAGERTSAMTRRSSTVRNRFKVGITRYETGDAADLAAFQRSTFGEDARQLDPARFEWLFERNPHRRDGEGPSLWICRRKGEIVGQQAEIPFTLDVDVDGTAVPGGWAIDLMVAPDWRIRGVGPGLVETHTDEDHLLVGLTQNEDAAGLYLSAGWTELGSVPVYLRPVDGRALLLTAPGMARLRPLASVVGLGLRGVDAVLGGLLRALGLALVPVDRFDDRVDEVWERAASRYEVLARRDRSTVAWSIDDRPDADEYLRFYLVRGSTTLGYVVLHETRHWGGRTMAVVDYLASPRWVPPLLTLAAHQARREGALAMMCRTRCAPADRALRLSGFSRRGLDVASPLRMFVHGPDGDDAVPAAVARSDAWFLTLADADLS